MNTIKALVVGVKLFLIFLLAQIIMIIPSLILGIFLGIFSIFVTIPISFLLLGFFVLKWKKWVFK